MKKKFDCLAKNLSVLNIYIASKDSMFIHNAIDVS